MHGCSVAFPQDPVLYPIAEDLASSGRVCLAVIKGRRRIGKSRLTEKFGRGKRFLSSSGLAPIKGVTAQNQRDAFDR